MSIHPIRMDEQAVVEQWSKRAPSDVPWLSDEEAALVVRGLKAEADRFWTINAHHSLHLADLIVAVGERRSDQSEVALGVMARGDALQFLGRAAEAWDALDAAGRLFNDIGDTHGWARTRIGRLQLCADLRCVDEALADATTARTIFADAGDDERLLRLDLNTGNTYYFLGEYRKALTYYDVALATAIVMGAAGYAYLGSLNVNSGIALQYLGNFREARKRYEQARAFFERRGERSAVADANLNLASLEQAEGHYPQALRLLHDAAEVYATEHLERDAALVGRDMAECYLQLNRYSEAHALAHEVRETFRQLGASAEEARSLVQLASIHAMMGDLVAAADALDYAAPIFEALGATAWSATIRQWRGRIALQQGDTAAARREAAAAIDVFRGAGQEVNEANAVLLDGQACLIDGDHDAAIAAGRFALQIARRANIPALRYAAHLLMGQVAERKHDDLRAIRRYRAAAATIERIERRLTITLRPSFLQDKGEALRALIATYLRTGRATVALEALEHAKSQVLLRYLANREHLRWSRFDATSAALRDELDRMRAEHQWFYALAYEPSAQPVEPVVFARARREIAVRERRMRAISEQLYLAAPQPEAMHGTAFRLQAVQERLGDDILIEFYNDGINVWAFTVDQHTVNVHPLALTVAALDRLVAQLQTNVAGALANGNEHTTRSLTTMAQRILGRLYDALLAPFADRWTDHQRLLVVPFGSLHVLPFHLLHTRSAYLFEDHEVVVHPTAGLLLRQPPQRPAGALVIGHSWNERLPATLDEARAVHKQMGGTLFMEGSATRRVLDATPTKVLHIAAHGEHRLDQPDLSYVRLDDGQVYADDLLQADLGYELVTLSGCETGRATVAAGDEPIGLGRALLYAGAGALLMSLWRVDDNSTTPLMREFYRRLADGATKIDALRQSQLTIYRRDPTSHPVYWGAFQLIGDPGPLAHTHHKERS